MAVYKRTWQTKQGEQFCWVCDYFARDPETNKLERVRETFERKGDADARWLEVHPRSRRGRANARSRKLTVKQAAQIWLDAVRVGRNGHDPAEPSTLRQYQTHVDLHIVPFFTGDKLTDLTAPRAATFRDHLLAKVSRPLAKKVLTSFKSMLREAESRGLISANPASTITIAGNGNSRHKEAVTIPGKADITAILTKLDELASQQNQERAKTWRRWRALVNTAIYTGMRASELRGLPWSNVNLKAGTITVKQRADETGKIGAPKSASGRRVIDIPAPLVKLLRTWRLECPKGKLDLVFPNWQGNVESHANITNRCWHPLLRHARVVDGDGALRFNFHSLRHFRASLLIADGANAKEVQTELGHATIQITLDLYTHLFTDDEAGAERKARAERLAASLGVA
jgi:integrase